MEKSVLQKFTGAKIFTVDLEEWYQGTDAIKEREFHKYNSRIEYSVHSLLDLFDRFNIVATFFVLGYVARAHPLLVKEINARGHEVASHGWAHELIYLQARSEFYNETKRSKSVLEDIVGDRVCGYRASNWSITKNSLWALDVLKELDFTYDSSIFPSKNYLYGIAGAPREPYFTENGILEIPPSVYSISRSRIPFSGGFYLRAIPKFFIMMLASFAYNKSDYLHMYIHPWEIDSNQPRDLPLNKLGKFIHYYNLKSTEAKLESLFTAHTFKSIAEYVS